MPMNNQERRDHAEQAVRAHLQSKGEPSPEQIEETEIADLIADLHHLAQIDGFDIERIDRLAAMHYEAEQADDIEQAPGAAMKTYTATIGVYVRAYTGIEFEAESDAAAPAAAIAKFKEEQDKLGFDDIDWNNKIFPAIVSISDDAKDVAEGIDFSLSKEDTVQYAASKLLIALNSMISIFEESTADWEDDSPGMAVMNEARAAVAEALG